MANDITPVGVDLDLFIRSMTQSLIKASDEIYSYSDAYSAHRYVVPEINVTVNMTFSFENGKVKGWFGRKTTETTSQQLESSVSFKIVAIPQKAPPQPLPPPTPPTSPPTPPP